ncbi:hypothetical protein [Chromohalobacter sp. HP20-39]|uniref:hypothetical protein n=1 Tax=Chromohalobacter sp. HP20-39 TaxID=3079306 RepID=UPI00294B5090|nr:hypothetical protein [Chromohalobacter sp. HP20-39]MDV6318757.1 hypothetical protein [Chromohalobacter sp. HP20-39]
MTDLAVTPEEDEEFAQLAQRYEERMNENGLLADSLESAHKRNEQLESQVLQLSTQLKYAEAKMAKAESQHKALVSLLETVATEVQMKNGYLGVETSARVMRAIQGGE